MNDLEMDAHAPRKLLVLYDRSRMPADNPTAYSSVLGSDSTLQSLLQYLGQLNAFMLRGSRRVGFYAAMTKPL